MVSTYKDIDLCRCAIIHIRCRKNLHHEVATEGVAAEYASVDDTYGCVPLERRLWLWVGIFTAW